VILEIQQIWVGEDGGRKAKDLKAALIHLAPGDLVPLCIDVCFVDRTPITDPGLNLCSSRHCYSHMNIEQICFKFSRNGRGLLDMRKSRCILERHADRGQHDDVCHVDFWKFVVDFEDENRDAEHTAKNYIFQILKVAGSREAGRPYTLISSLSRKEPDHPSWPVVILEVQRRRVEHDCSSSSSY
jgi:hypothetical protein